MSVPSFYCENCSREVSSGLDICPGCGQMFSSVRCPSCGFTGKSNLFKDSCPECGYTGNIKDNEDFVLNRYEAESDNAEDKGNVQYKNHLPSWLYRILIGFMVILIVSLVRIYFLL